MAREINLTSSEWCNIIFEDKNKEYGAFKLRQESSKRHYLAFGSVVLFTVLLFSLPAISNALGINKLAEHYTEEFIISDLTPPKPDVPEENTERVKTPEPPVDIKNSIKVTPPVIVEDELAENRDELISQETLSNMDVAIASATVTNGTENGILIDDLKNNRVLVQDETPVETTFDVVEIMPSFPGGEADLMKYLSINIRYPVICVENGIFGKVIVQFVVGKDGTIEDVRIAKGVDKNLDAEAIRVIKSMPKWIAGKQGGRAVKVKFYVPVNFQLTH